MEIEQTLADIIYGSDPMRDLEKQNEEGFAITNRKQFQLFHKLMLKRVEERLADQFGACLALLSEGLGLELGPVAKDFVCSAEYRLVREDLTELSQTSESRFEMAFLQFIFRTQNEHPVFLDEFSEIFLRELALVN